MPWSPCATPWWRIELREFPWGATPLREDPEGRFLRIAGVGRIPPIDGPLGGVAGATKGAGASEVTGRVLAGCVRLDDGALAERLPIDPARLSVRNRQRWSRFRCPADANRSALGELLACALALDLSFDAVVSHDPAGRPFLPGTDLASSISHSGRWVVAALASGTNAGVGIDVQEVLPDPIDAEVGRGFHPREAGWIEAGCSERVRSKRFYALWTIKEATAKILGLRLPEILGRDCLDVPDGVPGRGWMPLDDTHLLSLCWRGDPGICPLVRRFESCELLGQESLRTG